MDCTVHVYTHISYHSMQNVNLHRLPSFNLTIPLPFITVVVLSSHWLSMYPDQAVFLVGSLIRTHHGTRAV